MFLSRYCLLRDGQTGVSVRRAASGSISSSRVCVDCSDGCVPLEQELSTHDMHGCSCQGLILEDMGKNLAAGVAPRAKGQGLENQRKVADSDRPELSRGLSLPRPHVDARPLPRDSVCFVLRSTILLPSFQYCGPPVPPVVLQNATKSATSLNHHNRLNSPEHTAYLRVYEKLMYTCTSKCLSSHVQDKECLASLSKTSVVKIEHGLA